MNTSAAKDVRFPCLHPGCGASYRRKEHLVRHAARHSQIRVLICEECGVGFDRTDTLRRHRKIHVKLDAPVPRAARACDRCHAKKSKCDGNSPCAQCARIGAPCVFSRGGETDSTIQHDHHHQQKPRQVLSGEGDRQLRKRRHLDEPADQITVSQNRLRTRSEQPISTTSSLLSEEGSIHDLRMALMLQEARIQDDAVRLADSKVHDFDLDERNDLTDVISISADGSSMHSSPASDKIEYYVSLYFDHFHPHWPFIFKKAFPTRSEPTVLVLATAMIGMWITGEARLQRQAWMIHARLHIMLESQISTWCVSNRQSGQPNPARWPLATYQTILLFSIFTLVAHSPSDFDDPEEAGPDDALLRVRPIFTRLVRTCRAQGVFHYPTMIARNRADDPWIYRWTNLEELKYFALTLFKVSVLFSQLVSDDDDEDSEDVLSLSDLDFPLPDNGYLWAAPSIRELFCRRERQLRDPATRKAGESRPSAGTDHGYDQTTPWISELFGNKTNKKSQMSRAERRRAWMRLGPWLGYLAGVDPA